MLDGAGRVAERIRAATAVTPVVSGGVDIAITVSGGCALGISESPDDLLQIADTRLYEAKCGGRNRIVAVPAT